MPINQRQVVVPQPSQPVGFVASHEMIRRVRNWAERQPDTIFMSEAYRRLINMALDAADAGGKPKKKG